MFRDWIRSFASPGALGISKKWCLLLEAKWKVQKARHNQIAWTLAKQIKLGEKNYRRQETGIRSSNKRDAQLHLDFEAGADLA